MFRYSVRLAARLHSKRRTGRQEHGGACGGERAQWQAVAAAAASPPSRAHDGADDSVYHLSRDLAGSGPSARRARRAARGLGQRRARQAERQAERESTHGGRVCRAREMGHVEAGHGANGDVEAAGSHGEAEQSSPARRAAGRRAAQKRSLPPFAGNAWLHKYSPTRSATGCLCSRGATTPGRPIWPLARPAPAQARHGATSSHVPPGIVTLVRGRRPLG